MTTKNAGCSNQTMPRHQQSHLLQSHSGSAGSTQGLIVSTTVEMTATILGDIRRCQTKPVDSSNARSRARVSGFK